MEKSYFHLFPLHVILKFKDLNASLTNKNPSQKCDLLELRPQSDKFQVLTGRNGTPTGQFRLLATLR